MENKNHILYDKSGKPSKEPAWIFRTYAGHTNARESNELFRKNLSKGQTGLSIAFDLATQCGYSSDHAIAKPEIGKVGVPINTLEDFRILFNQIPIEEMNTSMTINGTSMYLLSLYVALAQERGVDVSLLQGTTQNDIIKEYLARGTYIFPPAQSIRIIVDMYEYCLKNIPKWNPSNICSYHLQEAGATPVQELAFALATAMAILDAIKERNCFTPDEFEQCVGRISFFVNAGIRFVEEMCKMRAFTEMWDEITKDRYGVKQEKFRRFRYGVQVNSLGLTEEQPENNAWRILIEALGVTMSRDARCRALQLPAWNEALSLPRPWDQQWSLRLQQVLAYETDLLEYPDLFEGSKVVESKVKELKEEAYKEIQKILDMGGAIKAIENGYMKSQLVKSQAERLAKINNNEMIIVGKNKWTEGTPSPLMTDQDGGVFKVDRQSAEETLEVLAKTKAKRDTNQVKTALATLEADAKTNKNLMNASIECAKAGVSTGEWADVLRSVFGEYRPATGVEGQKLNLETEKVTRVRGKVEAFLKTNGSRPKIVVGKPGLDGHSNGAEMIAVSAKHAGFDVIYSGIRLTPEEIVQTAVEENADVIGVSILSGSHLELAEQIFNELKHYKADIPVVFGGIIPSSDFDALTQLGVKAIFTPKDYDLMDVMERIIDIISQTVKAA
ncbi:methylmalonyl-CoA mutase family protein [Leptospira santarosai]|uniref:methylmalonyl-CoA mutase family protein n=1 Tax=Leptospira santarosai TaxID=28183 RepID=UPI0024AF6281|nr:methylmalonyl-CoA mutase family protein [Leptospira santarosai]MDI7236392.1 methylmalonyl-CoA mutase family protein [Leptospira santarosai]